MGKPLVPQSPLEGARDRVALWKLRESDGICAGYGKPKESKCKCGALWSLVELEELFHFEVTPKRLY